MVRGRRKPTAMGLGGYWTAGQFRASISHRPRRHNVRPGGGWAITTPVLPAPPPVFPAKGDSCITGIPANAGIHGGRRGAGASPHKAVAPATHAQLRKGLRKREPTWRGTAGRPPPLMTLPTQRTQPAPTEPSRSDPSSPHHPPPRHSRAGGNPRGEGRRGGPPQSRRAGDCHPALATTEHMPYTPPSTPANTRRSLCSGAAKLSHDVLLLSEKVRGGGPSVPRRCFAGRGPRRGRGAQPPCLPQRRRWGAWCTPLPALRDADQV